MRSRERERNEALAAARRAAEREATSDEAPPTATAADVLLKEFAGEEILDDAQADGEADGGQDA